MKNILKKRIRFIGIVIGVFLAINVALSFAYIRGGSVGSESVSTVAFEAGNIYVKYSDNSGDIVVGDIVPGFSVTKQFSISSNYGVIEYFHDLTIYKFFENDSDYYNFFLDF